MISGHTTWILCPIPGTGVNGAFDLKILFVCENIWLLKYEICNSQLSVSFGDIGAARKECQKKHKVKIKKQACILWRTWMLMSLVQLQTSDSGGAAVLNLPNGGMMPAPSDISYESNRWLIMDYNQKCPSQHIELHSKDWHFLSAPDMEIGHCCKYSSYPKHQMFWIRCLHWTFVDLNILYC